MEGAIKKRLLFHKNNWEKNYGSKSCFLVYIFLEKRACVFPSWNSDYKQNHSFANAYEK